MQIDMRGNMPTGYTPYHYIFSQNIYYVCRWHVYPIFRIIEKLKNKKWSFYAWLNHKGIMNTPEGCKMRLSDIWTK